MGNGRTSRLSDVVDGVIRPLNQAELKAATSLLKSTEGFTRLWPSVIVIGSTTMSRS